MVFFCCCCCWPSWISQSFWALFLENCCFFDVVMVPLFFMFLEVLCYYIYTESRNHLIHSLLVVFKKAMPSIISSVKNSQTFSDLLCWEPCSMSILFTLEEEFLQESWRISQGCTFFLDFLKPYSEQTPLALLRTDKCLQLFSQFCRFFFLLLILILWIDSLVLCICSLLIDNDSLSSP